MASTEAARHSMAKDEQTRQRVLLGIMIALLVIAGAYFMMNNQAHSTHSIPDKTYHIPIINKAGTAIVDEDGHIVQQLQAPKQRPNLAGG